MSHFGTCARGGAGKVCRNKFKTLQSNRLSHRTQPYCACELADCSELGFQPMRHQKPAKVFVVKAEGVRHFERTRTVKQGVDGGSLLRYWKF